MAEQMKCDRCGESLPDNFAMGDQRNGWNMVNVAPDAASGGTMVARHWRCNIGQPIRSTGREAVIAEAITALEPFAHIGIPPSAPDELWTHCDSYPMDIPEEEYQELLAKGVPLQSKEMRVALWIDGFSIGRFRRLKTVLASLRDLANAPSTLRELFKFQIGATVLKYRGSYKLSGTIKAHFFTSGGAPRYVVDHEPTVPGLLHIYNEDQLTDDLAGAPSEAQVCETCNGVGKIDERLGGIATSGWVDCPDCKGGAPSEAVGREEELSLDGCKSGSDLPDTDRDAIREALKEARSVFDDGPDYSWDEELAFRAKLTAALALLGEG
jgi:hypothetical protein